MKNHIYISKQKSYNLAEIEKTLRLFFEQLNIDLLLSDKHKIIIKPNMLGAHHPDKAVTTHPIILEAVIRILKDFNKDIVVGDSPGGIIKAKQIWNILGYTDICKKYNVELIEFGKSGIVEINSISSNNQAIKFIIDKSVIDCDGIINLPKMKTHSMMLYTGAVKNLYGTIPGLYKSELHKMFPSPNQFTDVLSELYNIIHNKIILNIMDGIIGMDGEGPSAGKPAPFELLMVSQKASSLDYIASKMMGFEIKNLAYLQNALTIDEIDINEDKISGAISIDKEWQDYVIPNVNIKAVNFRNKFLNHIPKIFKKLFKKYFTFYPNFLPSCKLCEVCVKSCPVQALKLSKDKDKIVLNKDKCINCLCCHEMCPYSAINIKKSFISKMIFKDN
ncbi:MAG: DUF362 domain-containing protein [Candidatus Cloacimonetes bacterium]|nr:DUF362 domain-containing protein [Candidatus Cloacimonadota bacterium]